MVNPSWYRVGSTGQCGAWNIGTRDQLFARRTGDGHGVRALAICELDGEPVKAAPAVKAAQQGPLFARGRVDALEQLPAGRRGGSRVEQ